MATAPGTGTTSIAPDTGTTSTTSGSTPTDSGTTSTSIASGSTPTASGTASTPGTAALFGRLHDSVNTHDLAAVFRTIDEVVAPDLVFHAPVPMGTAGAQVLKNVWTVLFRAFPDIRVVIEDTITEGDKTVFRSTVTGTHLGEYRGLPPTGRSVRYGEIFVMRVAGGRIAEIWGVVDVYAQLRQIGALPEGPA